MQSFEYYSPTEIVFGRGAEAKTAEKIKKNGGTRVVLVYGGGSVIRSGLLARLEKMLDEAGLHHISLGGVQPNPRVGFVREAIAKAVAFGADFILPVGGGSAIDSGKAIAHGTANPDADIWDIWLGKMKLEKTLPLGVVLTIAAAGSETSWATVITNEKGWHKVGFQSDLIRPVFTIMNPELLYTLPPYQMACGNVDMIMHVLERFFNPHAEDDLTDHLAAALISSVIKNAVIVKASPRDYNANFQIMWAGSLAHNGLFEGGNGRGDWGAHHIEMEISAIFDVAHGAGLAAVWPSWARYVYKKDTARFAKLARLVFGVLEKDDEKAALEGIDKMEAFFKSIDMPISLKELGVEATDDQLWEMARKCTKNDSKKEGVFGQLTSEDIYKIYNMAR